MNTATDDQFYCNMRVESVSLPDLLLDIDLLQQVPSSWHVIITDIKGSTHAVREGKHEQVNQIATGSIVTVLNIAFTLGITIPFFFGGDGATFIVPDSMIRAVMEALLGYRDDTYEKFQLYLRAGYIPVKDIYSAGQAINIAKFNNGSSFVIPVILGQGLSFAEKLIKSNDDYLTSEKTRSAVPDLNGMQCRWDRIPPPGERGEIVTLLIDVKNPGDQAAIFAQVLKKIEEIYGPFKTRQPISIPELKLKSTFRQLRIKHGSALKKVRWLEYSQLWINSFYCKLYFKTQAGKTYLQKLVEMSDTLVLDGRINTVISGTASQRKELLAFLDTMEYTDSIVYGMHISSASVMSCYVRDMDYDHIHFVDGSDGGYTQAAIILKRKLKYPYRK